MTAPSYLSASRLSAYSQCPALYRERYIVGSPMTPNVPVWFGNAVHSAIEAHFKGEDGETAFLRSWKNKKQGLGVAEVPVPAYLTRRGLDLLEAVQRMGLAGTPEINVSLRVAELPVPIVGFVDLYDAATNTVFDWKTSMRPWGPRTVEAQRYQPAIYVQAIAEKLLGDVGPATDTMEDHPLPRFVFVNLPWDGPVKTFEVEITGTLMGRVFEEARQMYEGMKAGVFGCTCKKH